MENIKNIPDLMVELLESNITIETMEITARGVEIINEISDYAEQTELFNANKDRGEMFAGSTAQQVFGYMLDRVVNAPAILFRDTSVLLIMPYFRQKLREEGKM